jgi:hypothetical protein
MIAGLQRFQPDDRQGFLHALRRTGCVIGYSNADAIKDDSRLRALSDCAGTVIHSRRRTVFLEAHGVAANSRRMSYRVVVNLGLTAMGC